MTSVFVNSAYKIPAYMLSKLIDSRKRSALLRISKRIFLMTKINKGA